MNPILVASTATGTGKTAVALALAQIAARRNLDVGYMKPKGTQIRSAVGKTLDTDPVLARELLGLNAELSDLEPVVYSHTFVQEVLKGREEPDGLTDRITESYGTLAAEHDLMIVEGGGLITGAVIGLSDVELARVLDAHVILVAAYTEPRDADAVIDAAARFDDRFGGVLFNGVGDAAYDGLTTDVVPFLETHGIRTFGTLPRVQELAGVTVTELATALGATTLTETASTAQFVERFVVGAMGADTALSQFRRTRDAVLVTGGGRSEIQTAALQAPGIEAILLTDGLQPSTAVLGRAERADIPILLVSTDTTTAIGRVEELVTSGRVRNERTIERMRSLLRDYADTDAMLGLTGSV
jgi:BioD-like phosphotransacetylase family protein